MRRTPFNDGWTVGAKANSFAELIVGAGGEPQLGDPAARRHDRSQEVALGTRGDGVLPERGLGVQEDLRTLARRPGERSLSGVRRRLSRCTGAGERLPGRAPSGRLLGLHRPGRPSPAVRRAQRSQGPGTCPRRQPVVLGCGLYRSAWLLLAGPVHLVPAASSWSRRRSMTRSPWWRRSGSAQPIPGDVERDAAPGDRGWRRHDCRRGRDAGHNGAGRRPDCSPTAVCPCTAPVGPGRSVSLHLPRRADGWWGGPGRGVDDVRHAVCDG